MPLLQGTHAAHAETALKPPPSSLETYRRESMSGSIPAVRKEPLMAHYDAYLLRIWRGGGGEVGDWAGRLVHLPDGGHQRFGSLEELLDYLRCALTEESGVKDADTEGKGKASCSDH
jgi:hypothetical protein